VKVAFTVSCARQKYLRASVDSWARVRGADQAQFVFCLEPSGSFPAGEFTEYVQRLFPRPSRAVVLQSAAPFGCLKNTRRAMELALLGDGFGVVAEEDVEVSDDILEYFTWARDAYRDDPKTVAVCAHTRSSKVENRGAVVRASWFAPLVWGAWRDRWDSVLAPAWGPQEGSNNPESWDNKLKQVIVSGGYQAVFPARSRSLHIGELSTLMGTLLGEYVYKASVSDCYSPTYPPGRFFEVPYPDGGLLWV
jgi:hypothetical protein